MLYRNCWFDVQFGRADVLCKCFCRILKNFTNLLQNAERCVSTVWCSYL